VHYSNTSKLELKTNSSEILPVLASLPVLIPFFFGLKVRIKDLKFAFCQFNFEVESQINLQLTDKISLEFDFSSSLLV